MNGQFYADDALFVSAWATPAGTLIVISDGIGTKPPALLHVGYWSVRKSIPTFLKRLLGEARNLDPLDPSVMRAGMGANDRAFLSLHLLALQKREQTGFESVVEDIAWRYIQLNSWGEASAAKVLADEFKIPIRTMHTRLRLARERNLINSPGSGERLGASASPTIKKRQK